MSESIVNNTIIKLQESFTTSKIPTVYTNNCIQCTKVTMSSLDYLDYECLIH